MTIYALAEESGKYSNTYRNSGTSSSASGWHRYKQALCQANVPEKLHRWYVKHVKTFLEHHPGIRLTDLSPDSVKLHLSQLSDLDFRQSWQQLQYIDAIEVLLTDTADLPWATDVPWKDLKNTLWTIDSEHATLAREIVNGVAVETTCHPELPESHRDSLKQLALRLRIRHYAYKTEQTYCHWVSRFLLENRQSALLDLNETAAESFLTNLTLRRNVSKGTQGVALCAICFYFKEVLGKPLVNLTHIKSQRPAKLPVVLTRDEINKLFDEMSGVHRMMASLMYGTGLRIIECLGSYWTGTGIEIKPNSV